jgi:hypothetical protein
MTAEQDQEHRTAKRRARRIAHATKASVRRRPPAKGRRATLAASPAAIVGNDAKSLGIAMIFTATLGLVVTSLLLSKRRRSVI